MTARRVFWLALWPAGLAFGAFSLAIARREPGYSFGGQSAFASAAELVAGYALLVVGLVAWARRPESRFGHLLTAASFGWFLLEWNTPGVGSAFVFTVGLVLYVACPPLVAHAALAYPDGRLRSWLERAGLAVAYAGAVLVLGFLPALVFDPAAEGCGQCPRNLLLIAGDSTAYESLNRVGVHLGLAWVLLLILLAAWQLVRSTPVRRRVVAPVLVAGGAYLGLVAADFAHSLDRGFLSNDAVDRRLWLGEAAALCALALGVVWAWQRARRTRSAVARLVVELADSPEPGGLRDVLATNLGDPSLQIAYPIADGARHVDAQGRPVRLDGVVTPLVRGEGTVAVLVHRPGLLDDAGLVEEVTAAARLALENERLQAEVRAQLEDLRASQARIIATGDAERRRLERDLHDGAQQRLVALSLLLRLARTNVDGATDERLAKAEEELRQALAELRELAHGIYPEALGEDGLAAALEALAETSPVPVKIGTLPEERFDTTIESTAYFVVAELVRRSGSGPVTVGVGRVDGQLIVEVGAVAAGDLTDLEDRVGALDGRLVVEPGRIRAEIPCA